MNLAIAMFLIVAASLIEAVEAVDMGVEAEHQTDDEQTMQLLQFAVGLNSSKGY